MAPGRKSYREEGIIERIESNTLFRISMIVMFVIVVTYVFSGHLSCTISTGAEHFEACEQLESRSFAQY